MKDVRSSIRLHERSVLKCHFVSRNMESDEFISLNVQIILGINLLRLLAYCSDAPKGNLSYRVIQYFSRVALPIFTSLAYQNSLS